MPAKATPSARAREAGRYRTIVADPPWDYGKQAYGFTRSLGGRAIDADTCGRPFVPYSTMSLDEIRELPVRELAAANAHLYLWTTSRFLRHAFGIAEGWGFKVSKPLVWCKPAHARPLGGTFGSATEFVLFGRRGTLSGASRTSTDWFAWPRGKHSAKPDGFFDLVERVSPGPYLELFARHARPGWDVWGDEAPNPIAWAA